MVRWELRDQVEDQPDDDHLRVNISYLASDRLRVEREDRSAVLEDLSFGTLSQLPACTL